MVGKSGDTETVYNYGSYCFCETVKVEGTRVPIDKLKKKDAENITGGYLMATYSNQGKDIPASTVFVTNYGVEFMNDTPEYETEELTEAQQSQRTYIRGFMQEVENLIMAPDDIDDARHAEIASRMDLTSLADYWLLQEISFNTDGFGTTSTYLYKKRDGKLYWGPLWDFDYGWNNNGQWNASNETFNNTALLWIDQLRAHDPQFVSLLKERWSLLNEKLIELTRDGSIIDQYAAEVRTSQSADYGIWSALAGEHDKYKGTTAEEFEKAVADLKGWIEARRAWADSNIDDINKVYFTVRYEAIGQVVATEQVRYGEYGVMNPDAPAPEGKVFAGWKSGSQKPSDVEIKEDTTFTAEYVDEGEATAPESLSIYAPDDLTTVQLSSGFFPVTVRREVDQPVPRSLDDLAAVEPWNATNPRIRWTSSDEAVASIDETNHRVILNGGGDVTITGTLYNGVSASFVLHVEGEPAKYTIRFVNDDDTELQSEKLPRGETPTYTGATPIKAETDRYSYEFAGWTPEVVPVAGNAVYKATYKQIAKAGAGEYDLASGAGGTWTEGSADPLVFVFKRKVDDETTIDHFTGVEVDGELVQKTDSSGRVNYTAEKGSAVVSLQPAFLATLARGGLSFVSASMTARSSSFGSPRFTTAKNTHSGFCNATINVQVQDAGRRCGQLHQLRKLRFC